SRPDITEEILAEIRQYVPGAIVHQAQYLAALVRILADGDVEISHIRVERRANVAIVEIELSIVQGGLGSFAARIDIAVLPKFILGPGDLTARARDCGFVGRHPATRIENIISGNEMTLQ